MRTIELFSGAGGLAKGLEGAGFDHVAFVELNRDACATLRTNFRYSQVIEGDIGLVDFNNFSDIDLVAGGPPCQPFSLGGKHKAWDDHRDMFPDAIRAIRTLMPSGFLFENVKGLLRRSFAEYFQYVLLRLTFPAEIVGPKQDWNEHLMYLRSLDWDSFVGPKYRVEYKLLNSADYGVPQRRERVFIVGIRADLRSTWNFPKPTHSKDRLEWEKFVTTLYWDRHGLPPRLDFKARDRLLDKYGLLEPDLLPWRTIRDALIDTPDPRQRPAILGHEYKAGARPYPGHVGSEIDLPSKTIKAGDHGVPGGENMILYEDGSVRYLTTYEAKLIQTFPVDFQIKGSWGESLRQIGNAVPVELAKTLGQGLATLLNSEVRKSA